MSATFEHAIATDSRTERSERAFRVVRVALGLLLLTAAGLKLYGMNVTALPRAGWFATPRVQIMAAEWELALGLWLLSGVFQFGAWLAAIGTFATFAGVSAYFGWIGVANCGCFGVIHTSPWVAFAVDVAVITMLAFVRPITGRKAVSCPGLAIPIISRLLFFLIEGIGIPFFGVAEAALAKMRGDTVTVDPLFTVLGAAHSRELFSYAVEISNWIDEEIAVLGGTATCSLTVTIDLPVTFPAHKRRVLQIRSWYLVGRRELSREARG